MYFWHRHAMSRTNFKSHRSDKAFTTEGIKLCFGLSANADSMWRKHVNTFIPPGCLCPEACSQQRLLLLRLVKPASLFSYMQLPYFHDQLCITIRWASKVLQILHPNARSTGPQLHWTYCLHFVLSSVSYQTKSGFWGQSHEAMQQWYLF